MWKLLTLEYIVCELYVLIRYFCFTFYQNRSEPGQIGKFLLAKSLCDTIITICPFIADSPRMTSTKVYNVVELLRIPSPIAETILSLLDTDSFLTFRQLSKECNEKVWT